jgi:spore coat protein A
LLEHPVTLPDVDIAPGERYDVVVDFSVYPVGSTVDLVNDLGTGSTRDVMRFQVARRGADDSRVPELLSRTATLDPARAVRTRDWRFRRGGPDEGPAWVVNGRGFDPLRADAEPRLGEVEIWRFSTDLRHPVHVHLNAFQVLSRRGDAAGRYDAGWKDTVDVAPRETVEVAVRFTDYAGRYLLHCHTLEHEDMAMMALFRTS